jgi:hypothetical protein
MCFYKSVEVTTKSKNNTSLLHNLFITNLMFLIVEAPRVRNEKPLLSFTFKFTKLTCLRYNLFVKLVNAESSTSIVTLKY